MPLRFLMLSSGCALALVAMACGDGHGDHCTSTDEAICFGAQIQYCDGAHYGEPEDCPEAQECATMDSGLTHCMLSAMIEEGEHDHTDMEGRM
ncbi:MAG: hypothetical protein ACPGU1_03050 [Myxococcota bacterium]